MQHPLNGGATLETMPLEILNDIFVFASSEDLDLSLLQVSRGITWKLLDHPIVRTVRGFWPADQDLMRVGRQTQNFDIAMPLRGMPLGGLACYKDERKRIQEAVLTSAWCTPAFLRRMQVAFIRRMVKVLWDPFLQRDGIKKCAQSQPAFWSLLDRVAYNDGQMEEENMEICLTDNETRYSWTRIRISLWEGRIVIRDQLLNRTFEKTLPFLQSVFVERQRFESAVSGGTAI